MSICTYPTNKNWLTNPKTLEWRQMQQLYRAITLQIFKIGSITYSILKELINMMLVSNKWDNKITQKKRQTLGKHEKLNIKRPWSTCCQVWYSRMKERTCNNRNDERHASVFKSSRKKRGKHLTKPWNKNRTPWAIENKTQTCQLHLGWKGSQKSNRLSKKIPRNSNPKNSSKYRDYCRKQHGNLPSTNTVDKTKQTNCKGKKLWHEPQTIKPAKHSWCT